ncbi:MAG TPA: hypothetical protein VEP73_10290, partial [Actinomycetota bacterium]|nr:hypothetical protein [Actinomycetota bacterium]
MSVDVEPQPVLGRPGFPGRPSGSARAASAIALLAGLLNLASAALPAERSRLALLDAMVPGAVSSGAAVWTAAAGVGLILLAGGLRRHRRTAWVATLGLLAGSAVSHLVKGLDVEEALVEAFLAGLLTAKGDRFTAHPGPGERAPVVRPAIAVAVTTLTFGVAGLLVNRGDVAEDLPLRVLVVQAARMAAGFGTSLTVTGRFWRAFPGSVAAVFYLGAALVLAQALAPARCR